MNLTEFNAARDRLNDIALKTMAGKRPAYTNMSEDVLANFKRVAQRTGLAPAMVAYIYFLKHVDALGSHLAGNESDPEPIEMRLVDIRNYVDLIYALLDEDTAVTDTLKIAEDYVPPEPGEVIDLTPLDLIAGGIEVFREPETQPGDTLNWLAGKGYLE